MNTLKMNNINVKMLRKNGFRTRVCHIRQLKDGSYMSLYDIRERKFQQFIENSGGETVVDITTPDMLHTATGISECSHKDGYNKKIGIAIALGRAVSKLQAVGYLT